jgi:hypothetical protein
MLLQVNRLAKTSLFSGREGEEISYYQAVEAN